MSAVRFERINQDSTTEAKEVTRLVPKILKRKSRHEEDSGQSDDENLYSEDHVISKDEVVYDNTNEQ